MIRLAGKTFFNKHWLKAGVRNINDLLISDL